ncbi:hypothetical protein V8F06_010693 [Rhypophila decipiens]
MCATRALNQPHAAGDPLVMQADVLHKAANWSTQFLPACGRWMHDSPPQRNTADRLFLWTGGLELCIPSWTEAVNSRVITSEKWRTAATRRDCAAEPGHWTSTGPVPACGLFLATGHLSSCWKGMGILLKHRFHDGNLFETTSISRMPRFNCHHQIWQKHQSFFDPISPVLGSFPHPNPRILPPNGPTGELSIGWLADLCGVSRTFGRSGYAAAMLFSGNLTIFPLSSYTNHLLIR